VKLVTHVTEYGLAGCARKLHPPGRSKSSKAVRARMQRIGIRRDTVACDGSPAGGRYRAALIDVKGDVILSAYAMQVMPTCPRCAVLRDAALEGRLP
jgi:hypothetical protein